jgi:hypothetical protein
MRIMAGEAIARRWRMDGALDVRGLLVGMAIQAKAGRRSGDELDARYIFIDPDFMAGKTSHGHGGVNGLAFGFFSMALEAFGSIGVLVQGHGMNHSAGPRGEKDEESGADPKHLAQATGTAWVSRFAGPSAIKHELHSRLRIGRVAGGSL